MVTGLRVASPTAATVNPMAAGAGRGGRGAVGHAVGGGLAAPPRARRPLPGAPYRHNPLDPPYRHSSGRTLIQARRRQHLSERARENAHARWVEERVARARKVLREALLEVPARTRTQRGREGGREREREREGERESETERDMWANTRTRARTHAGAQTHRLCWSCATPPSPPTHIRMHTNALFEAPLARVQRGGHCGRLWRGATGWVKEVLPWVGVRTRAIASALRFICLLQAPQTDDQSVFVLAALQARARAAVRGVVRPGRGSRPGGQGGEGGVVRAPCMATVNPMAAGAGRGGRGAVGHAVGGGAVHASATAGHRGLSRRRVPPVRVCIMPISSESASRLSCPSRHHAPLSLPRQDPSPAVGVHVGSGDGDASGAVRITASRPSILIRVGITSLYSHPSRYHVPLQVPEAVMSAELGDGSALDRLSAAIVELPQWAAMEKAETVAPPRARPLSRRTLPLTRARARARAQFPRERAGPLSRVLACTRERTHGRRAIEPRAGER